MAERSSRREPSPMTTLTNSHDLLAAVPFLIGYHPEDSLVIISIRDKSVGVAMRIDYPQVADREQIELLVSHIEKHSCDGVLIVSYIPERCTNHNEIGRALTQSLENADISVRENLEVRAGRWRSLICEDEKCCPPGGNQLPEFTDSTITAEQVADGVPLPFSGVAALKASLYAKQPSLPLLAALSRVEPMDYSHAKVQKMQREGALAVKRLVKEFAEKGVAVDGDLVALVLVRLQDLQIRDYALGMATVENQETLTSLWRWCTSIAPQGFAAAPATLYSELMYENGEGAIATRALERALDDAPDYALAKLLRRTFAAGWEPSAFRQMRSELHPKICEALFMEAGEE